MKGSGRKERINIKIIALSHSISLFDSSPQLDALSLCIQKWSPAACRSKPIKKQGEEILFWMLTNRGGEWEGRMPVQRPIPRPTRQSGSKSFHRQTETATCGNSTVSSVVLQLVTSGLTRVVLLF